MTEFENIFHIVHALAIAKLRDVHQAVTARKDVDERTELGDAHNATCVDGVELCGRRINNRKDASLCLFNAEVVW